MPKSNVVETRVMEKRRPLRILGIIVAVIVGLIAAVLIGFNIYIKVTYADFYTQATEEFQEPGISSGFIPQDLDYLEDSGTWLFSGYTGSDSPSPLYKRTADGKVQKLTVNTPDGFDYMGHGSAITSNDLYAYMATDEGYMVFYLSDVEAAQDGDTITACGEVSLNVSPAFTNIENDYLYAGNFYDGKTYTSPEDFHLTAPDGQEHGALMFAYRASNDAEFGYETVPEVAYSITGKVQGMCVTESGSIILSTSWGFSASHLYEYDVAQLSAPDGTYSYDGNEIPLYFLDSRTLVRDITGPPMFEGIEDIDGRVYISDESASNKYIFGKLYGAGKVFSIPV